MSDKSSGTYVIDAEYNVVSYNQTIHELYPQLVRGKKCYKCLMGLDEPCPPCPVAGHIHGPQTYLDPIRGIYETVDAVDIVFENGKEGHALVMSTVGESETIAAKLPRSRDELERLLEQKYFDSLTGGYSRSGFIRQANLLFSRVPKTDYAVVMFNIQNFKAINDVFGVEGGDQVLKTVFETLQTSWLSPVISARAESDWFLFLVNRSRIGDHSLNTLLNLEWSSGTRIVTLHLRCGVYFAEDSTVPVSNMVEWATLAIKFAEQESYGGLAVFNKSMRHTYMEHAAILSSFRSSMRNGDFQIWYQPIVRASDGRLCSAEALVRWIHPKAGMLSPGNFIPALEKGGMISELDRYVVKHVFSFQDDLKTSGLATVPISVNLSRQDFYDDQLMSDVFRLAQEHNLTGRCVNFEVTETSVAALRQNCSYLLGQIRQSGAKVLLDDFGSGYSSLSMIGDYSFDIIKIDKSFIDQIENKPTVRAIISSAIDMCHRIGLKTVAEGVENAAQLEFLRGQHCDYIQGYYFAKPMKEEDFLACLAGEQKALAMDAGDEKPPFLRDFDSSNLEELIDHSGQFIQVCHPEDYTMVYANAKTLAISGHPELPYAGQKCYQYMLGLDAPCGHCPMKKMGTEAEKEIEVDDGAHVFALKARYTMWNGRKVFIEYGRDVTGTKVAKIRYHEQIQSILENLPKGQGVFRMDLTDDRWLSSGGIAQNARDMQNIRDVDTLIHMIAAFVPDEAGQQQFFALFCREAQLRAYRENQHQIVHETKSYYDDRSIRWSRITVQMIDNPENGHIESLLYGIDISRDRERVAELESERLQSLQEKDALQKDVSIAWGMSSKAEQDRRIDCLTGLNSRLDLGDTLQRAKEGTGDLVSAILMLDIDDFKLVNDTYGHTAGDLCLRAIGKVLLEFGTLHAITFYRFGGERILGIFHRRDCGMKETVEALLETVRRTRIPLKGGQNISLTASVGYTEKGADYQEMIRIADQAMAAAKRRGKNQAACFDEKNARS